MKKIIVLFLCSILLFALCACNEEDKTNDVSSVEESSVIYRDKIAENKYTSAFAGFSFTKPDDWVFLSDDEIATSINVGQQLAILNNIEQALEENAIIYDMVARHNEKGDSVIVKFENTMLSKNKELTLDEAISNLKDELNAEEILSYDFEDAVEFNLGETKYIKIEATVTAQNIDFKQIYYLRVNGKHLTTVILNAINTNASEIENMFGK